MNPDARLSLVLGDDGDVDIMIVDAKHGAENTTVAAIEFCASGGHSPRTLQALKWLALAMKLDAE